MTVSEFLVWGEAQSEGRYELVDGQIIAMAPERALHNLAKMSAWVALSEAVERAGLPCTVYGDGMMVEINEYRARGPDVLVQCGNPIDLDALVADNPLVVVEVASPSSERDDKVRKLVEYFSVGSIRHYLVVLPDERIVVHHARSDAGRIETKIVSAGTIELSPPGLVIPSETMFAGLPPP
jgi:Uma2 family endonuclease